MAQGFDGWSTKDGYREIEIKIGSGTVTIRRPILSDEEREKRYQEVISVLSNFK